MDKSDGVGGKKKKSKVEKSPDIKEDGVVYKERLAKNHYFKDYF